MITGGVAVPQTAGRHRRPARVGEDEGGLDQVVVRLDGVAGRLMGESSVCRNNALWGTFKHDVCTDFGLHM